MNHILTINIEGSSITTGNIITKIENYGMFCGIIEDNKQFEANLQTLIFQHEEKIEEQVEYVYLICNALNLTLEGVCQSEKMQLKSLHLRLLNMTEHIDKKSGLLLLKILKNNGVQVLEIASTVGLFIAEKLTKQLSVISIGAKSVFVYSICNEKVHIQKIEKGLLDCISFTLHKTLQKYPHIDKKAILLIIQNFIYFSEVEMIQKIQTTQHGMGGIFGANYEIMSFVAKCLKGYLLQMFEGCVFEEDVYLHTEESYVESFAKVMTVVSNKNCKTVEYDFGVNAFGVNDKATFYAKFKRFLEIFNLRSH